MYASRAFRAREKQSKEILRRKAIGSTDQDKQIRLLSLTLQSLKEQLNYISEREKR